MKKVFFYVFIMLLGLVSTVSSQQVKTQSADYKKLWSKADSLINEGLPKSAKEVILLIYNKSKKENDVQQYIKSLIYKLKVESLVEENYSVKAIVLLEEEIKNAAFPQKQIMYSMLAELYWNYYQENRYNILQRSITVNFSDKDIETWDLLKIVSKTMDCYNNSLKNIQDLRNIKIEQIEGILIKAKNSEKYRPTLYDFLAFRALDFYMEEESDLTRPAYKFELNKIDYFSSADVFAKMTITTKDTLALKFYALKLMQQLLTFHSGDNNPQALVDADLLRLKFVRDNSILPAKDSLYIISLQRNAKKYEGQAVAADIFYDLALAFYKRDARGDYISTVDLCERLIKEYPVSVAAANAAVLMADIKQASLALTVEFGNTIKTPVRALVEYNNTETLYLRLINIDYDEDAKLRQSNYGRALIDVYTKKQITEEWQIKLPVDKDFKTHKTEIKIPAQNAGYFILLASDNAGFSYNKGIVTYQNLWFSDLSYIKKNNLDGSVSFYVLNRTTGNPVEGVNVQSFLKYYDYQSRAYVNEKWKNFITDKKGFFSVPYQEDKQKYRTISVVFSYKKDKFTTDDYFSQYKSGYEKDANKVIKSFFFTDRAIYRPGQTIYFKGIIIEKQGKKSEIKPDYSTIVYFYDVNQTEIAKLKLKSNEFGSFNGSFTAPQGGLTGYMYITDKIGSASFSVEEYKRPKFEVTYNPVAGSFRLGETLTVKGTAMAYAGFPIDNATVKYNVRRVARFPFFNEWWCRDFLPYSPSMEISNGVIKTNDKGVFSIDFNAIPDYSVEKRFKPVFDYVVHCDVTDINGETHSASKTVSVGYVSLLINTDIPENVNNDLKFKFNLKTVNLAGVKEPAKGSIKVYVLKQPAKTYRKRLWSKPDRFVFTEQEFNQYFPLDEYNDETNMTTWAKAEMVYSSNFDSANDSLISFNDFDKWKQGAYYILIETKDKYGEKIEKENYFTVYSAKNNIMPLNSPQWFFMQKTTAEPGETASFIIGSKEKDFSLLYEVYSDDKIISEQWLKLNEVKKIIEIPILEEYRGNIGISLTAVKNNRIYKLTELIKVPYTNKELDIKFETFRDKLKPGAAEEWKIKISDKKGIPIPSEMLASLYDASLDAFVKHKWDFNIYNYFYPWYKWDINDAFKTIGSIPYTERERLYNNAVIKDYDRLNWFGYSIYGNYYRINDYGLTTKTGGSRYPMMLKSANKGIVMEDSEDNLLAVEEITHKTQNSISDITPDTNIINEETNTEINARSNFNETAFFYPAFKTNEQGELLISFTVPETLTKWKLLGLTHTKDLKYSLFSKELVTQKELMINTNAPRFLRQGDKIFISAKITNLTNQNIEGQAELKIYDAVTMKEINNIISGSKTALLFKISQNISSQVQWQLNIPDNISAVTLKITARSGNFSDGEEITLPVLSNRMLVTESLPLHIKGKQSKTFVFDKLKNASDSKTLTNFKLTLEFTSNPIWLAVQALPYIMESDYESADEIFNKYYANSIAFFIVNSNPKIKKVFDMWRNYTPSALLSNLEKNQELKALLLQETPWVMDAKDESERKQRVALLFDINKMSQDLSNSFNKLQKLQTSNGAWSWFPGMPDNRFITQYIVTGFGHLKQLKVLNTNSKTNSMLKEAINYLDNRLRDDYEWLKKNQPKEMDKQHISATEIQYLYARSYFIEEIEISSANKEAYDYYKKQAVKFRNNFNNYSQAMIALAMNRTGDKTTTAAIIKSLKEKSLQSEEMGTYWKDNDNGYYWYQLPVETQALLIELFEEAGKDKQFTDDMRVWLIKQKQTRNWQTPKATAEACYALLIRGSELLESEDLVDIKLGNTQINPYAQQQANPEAGTGYFKISFTGEEIKSSMADVTVSKKTEGAAWGSLYWQYFEQLDKITTHSSPISIEKKVFRELSGEEGRKIELVSDRTKLSVGDRLRVRIVIRTDREMEYVHLKDMRASGLEPVNVLSSYKYQGGLGYYEATKDASVSFFIESLGKGTYVFEYPLIVSQKGDFSNGITSIQCLYAPEFTSHSEGIRITVE